MNFLKEMSHRERVVSSLEKAEEDRISAYISLKHYHGGRHSPCSGTQERSQGGRRG